MKSVIRAFKTFQTFMRNLMGVLLAVMVLVVFLQTFCRFVIFRSLTWSEELSRYLFVAIIVLGVNLATTDHMFVRIEIIDNYLKGKAKLGMDAIRKFVALLVSIIMVYSSYRLIIIGGYQVSPAMSIPMSFLYGIILVGFVLNVCAVFFDIYETFCLPDDLDEGKEEQT